MTQTLAPAGSRRAKAQETDIASTAQVPLDATEISLLRALRHGAKGRAELAQETGWSRNTVAAKLNRLIDSDWVSAGDATQAERGRPSARYGLNPQAALTLVARFEGGFLEGTLCTLTGDQIATGHQPLTAGYDPTQSLADLRGLRDTLQALPEATGPIRACVLVVPGPVSGNGHTVPWSQVGELPADLDAALDMRIAVENDANLMALGAIGEHPQAESLLYVLVQTGIGAGLAFGGQRGAGAHVHRGLGGWSGEVGHIPVRAAGDRPCICGARGCLASVASHVALLKALSTPDRILTTTQELQDLVAQGNIDAIVALRDAGRTIGEALVGLVTGLAPEVICLGGPLVESSDHISAGVRESLNQRTPPALSQQLTVLAGRDHGDLARRGAVDRAFDLLLPPAAQP
ncbi:Fructokinase [Aquimixticola soesokkakensis]|uniref:Fructokinase n=1 Tax=Aquimixticola soesokkakensis TaxID=1519096 RepID=A0A1Y5T8F8_9RHOB|nr:ROK family protein [Aquimixticola soesokkakensis]SLN56320.1 Fructokinase [Aquimixticola soesokkakensis]